MRWEIFEDFKKKVFQRFSKKIVSRFGFLKDWRKVFMIVLNRAKFFLFPLKFSSFNLSGDKRNAEATVAIRLWTTVPSLSITKFSTSSRSHQSTRS
jgi:hypothetical protein